MEKVTWRSIANELSARIESGDLLPGTRLESEEDMATRLGVSRHTAHRALNELQRLGLLERKRRWGTVVAQTQKPEGNRRIAYLVDFASNRFQADLMAHIEHALDEETRLMVATSRNDLEREAEQLQKLAQEVDGIICYPCDGDGNAQTFLDLAASGFPLVLVDRAPRGCEDLVVLTDNVEASRHAVDDLIQRGHKKIAFFGSNNDRAQSIRERYHGYRSAVEGLGYSSRAYERWIPLNLDHNSDMMYQTISDALLALRTLPEPPTAAFCVQDWLAAGLLEACAA
ncbi:GntR family transcriptional regulator, partial [bacterium]